PAAVFLVVLLVQLIGADGTSSVADLVDLLLRQGIVGAAAGIAGGFAITFVLNRVTFPSGLDPLLVVASAVAIYAMTSLVNGSGFLAVYLAGIIVGNRPRQGLRLDPELPQRGDLAVPDRHVPDARPPRDARRSRRACRAGA